MKYDKYLKDQLARTENKWGRKPHYEEIFIQQLRLSIKKVESYLGSPNSICCMGCRSGTEVFEFKERYPKAEVYGVDISHRIKTIKTHLEVHIKLEDFNNLPNEWENKFDLVFSNSIDHAFDPIKTFKEWQRVTKPSGHLLVEFSTTPTHIEHSFKKTDVKKLKPVVMWELPKRSVITGLFTNENN